MTGTQYDDLNQYDVQRILDQAGQVIREVDQGSTDYTPEQLRHAQDTQRELADYLGHVEGKKDKLAALSGSELANMVEAGIIAD